MNDRRRWVFGGIVAIAIVAIGGLWIGFFTGTGGDPAARGDAGDGGRGTAGDHGARGGGASASDGADDGAGDEAPSAPDGAPALTRRQPIQLSPAEARADATARYGALAGHVVSFADGGPVVGAELTFAHGGRGASVETNAEGAFTYEPTEAGVHVLALVTAEGHHPHAPEWDTSPLSFVARPQERIDGIVVYLTPEARYTGLVIDEDGQPVAGAEILLVGSDAGTRALAPAADARWLSGADGAFAFVAPDGALLTASHAEAGRGRARIGFAAQASRSLSITLHPGPATTRAQLAGVVHTPDGQPLPGAQVFAMPTPENAALPGAQLLPSGSAMADDEGRFHISELDAGPHQLTATASGWATARLSVDAPADDVVLELGDEARLRGTVREAVGGAPIASSTVVVERARGMRRSVAATATTFDGEGRFEVRGLAPGTYEVSATAYGYAPSAPSTVSLEADGANVEIRLGVGGQLTGTVTSGPDGAPLTYARVSLEGRLGGGSGAVPLLSSVTADDAGRFTLSGVAPGSRSLFVAAEGHHGRVVSGLLVTEGGTREVVIDLTPTEEGETPRIELAGIGAVLAAREDGLVIGRVVEGGGAAEAGLGPDDVIVAIDGVPVSELGFGGSIERIRGPEGSTLLLRVKRAGSDDTEELVVPRRRIRA